jgi:hypothetical protein
MTCVGQLVQHWDIFTSLSLISIVGITPFMKRKNQLAIDSCIDQSKAIGKKRASEMVCQLIIKEQNDQVCREW